MNITPSLQHYIQSHIIPLYDQFDPAHQRDHVQTVITQSLQLAKHYAVNPDMVYAIAAYHDTGLSQGRTTHHLVSGQIIRHDTQLRQWFTEDQIEIMAQAAEDHRASSDHAPRTIYGLLLAEADRTIDPHTIIRRTIQYGLAHYPELSPVEQYERTRSHLREKYGDGGYLKLWIPESPNAARLEALRVIIRDEDQLSQLCSTIYQTLHTPES